MPPCYAFSLIRDQKQLLCVLALLLLHKGAKANAAVYLLPFPCLRHRD